MTRTMCELTNGVIAIIGSSFLAYIIRYFFPYVEITAPVHLFCFLLSYPWQIGKNTYSLWGGYNQNGNVYSIVELSSYSEARAIFSLFSISITSYSKENTYSLAGVRFLSFSDGRIEKFIGIIAFSSSKEKTKTTFGVLFAVKAEDDIMVGVGFIIGARTKVWGGIYTAVGPIVLAKSCNQIGSIVSVVVASKADNGVEILIGCICLTKAEHMFAGFGLVLLSQADEINMGVCVAILSKSKKTLSMAFGLLVLCSAKNAILGIVIPLAGNLNKKGTITHSIKKAWAELD